MVEEGVRDDAVVDVGDAGPVSLGVGVDGGGVVEEGVKESVVVGVGDADSVSLSVGVPGG